VNGIMLKDIAAAQRSSPRKEEEVVRHAAVVKEIADVTIAVMEWIFARSKNHFHSATLVATGNSTP